MEIKHTRTELPHMRACEIEAESDEWAGEWNGHEKINK